MKRHEREGEGRKILEEVLDSIEDNDDEEEEEKEEKRRRRFVSWLRDNCQHRPIATDTRETSGGGDKVLKSARVPRLINQESSDVRR